MLAVLTKALKIAVVSLVCFSPAGLLLAILFLPLDSVTLRDGVRLTGLFKPGGFVAIVCNERSVKGLYKADIEFRPVAVEVQRIWSGQRIVIGDDWGGSILHRFSDPSWKVAWISMAATLPIPERNELRHARVDVLVRGSVDFPRLVSDTRFENQRITLDDTVTLSMGSSIPSSLRLFLGRCWIWMRWQFTAWLFFVLLAFVLLGVGVDMVTRELRVGSHGTT
jgi:hypothetical protein